MINPVNFRASVSNVALTQPVDAETPKTENVTNPITNEASFKGADALAVYNKAFLAVDTENNEDAKALAFKGEEVEPQTESQAPAFKGEDVEQENNTPAFKGEETETVDDKGLAFRGEEVEETPEKAETEDVK